MQWIPTEFVWQNYVDIWTRIPMLTYLKNSLFLSVTITILQVLTGSFAAYGFSKMHLGDGTSSSSPTSRRSRCRGRPT